MRTEFRLPDIGEGLAEAEVIRWLVGPGERVAEDQPVVELQTDKAAVELPSPAAGVLVEQLAAEGDTVRVGAVLFALDMGPAAADAGAHTRGFAALPQASPAVRRLARELGVDLAAVRGSGPHGRVLETDVRAAAEAAAAPRPAVVPTPAAVARPADPDEERQPLRGVRRQMADNMALSARTIPHVTGLHEMDATALGELWSRLRARAERFPIDVLLVRIAALALRQHPIFNASLDEAAGEVVYHRRINVGVAVSTPQGLVVPVVRDADRIDLRGLAAELDRLVAAARSGRIALADITGGTFTVTNSGGWNGWFGTSLIHHPEVAIMGVGRIQERAVVRGGQVVVRPILPV
ncbi:MAG TPA: dihydrolipoamide acetyltransferase family protein, partial [Candidatus Dormibacteraeota bacterium]|nr:dihydrolipoamide acetyltransferase family protein [Candidatus Dormibacteraeota bacterium]